VSSQADLPGLYSQAEDHSFFQVARVRYGVIAPLVEQARSGEGGDADKQRQKVFPRSCWRKIEMSSAVQS
jgi:hypothetical protein